jgi:protein-disulfide isomerase/uncharacterized membrane protein
MSNRKPIKPLPYRVYYLTVLFVALGGFADSAYLAISHYRVYNDIGYSSFCAISRAINCDTVSQSPQAILWSLPSPVWGVFGYLCYVMLLGLVYRPDPGRHRLWPTLFLVSLGFCLYSIYLAYVSTFKIHAYCIMCIVDYGINFGLLYFCWLIRRRFQGPGLIDGLKQDLRFLWAVKKRSVPLGAVLGVLIVGTLVLFPRYWKSPPPLVSSHIQTGTTADGHPWIGAADPEIVITEFTDYQCFQCNKLHYYLRRIIAQKPGKLRLVHRHFPMDHRVNPLVKQPYHMRAGALALMAIYAAEQGRFWPMNDYLFVIARGEAAIRIEDVARKTGLDPDALKQALVDPGIRKKLKQDITDGIQLGIEGTPGFIIDGQVYQAMLPPEILKRLLQ